MSITPLITFQELAASRRDWIQQVLVPWCRQASLSDLKEAEFDWLNIAGRVDPAATLWTWAWSRFPPLVHEGMAGLDETREVRVSLKNGSSATGYPDNRASRAGRLVLTGRDDSGRLTESGPFSLDEIATVEWVEQPQQIPTPVNPPARAPTVLPAHFPDDQRL